MPTTMSETLLHADNIRLRTENEKLHAELHEQRIQLKELNDDRLAIMAECAALRAKKGEHHA